MMRNPYQSYVEQDVQSGDPLKLVQMLYRGAIDAVSAARVHLRQGAIRERSRQIGKALAIVHELLRSLDRHQEISKSLARLYVYMTKRLIEPTPRRAKRRLPKWSGCYRRCSRGGARFRPRRPSRRRRARRNWTP